MNKKFLQCISVLAAATVLAAPVLAAEKQQRRKSFFESIFGGSPRTVQREPVNDAPWWMRRDDGTGVRVIRDGKMAQAARKNVPVADIDPEDSEGLGMGNKVYVPPKLERVFSPAFAKLTTADAANSAIRLVLADKATPVVAVKAVRDAVTSHYEASGFAPLWIKNGKLTDRGHAVLTLLSKAGDEGLEPARYLPKPLTSFADPDGQIGLDGLGAAQLDVGLTVAAATYAQHISGGAYEPDRLSGYYDLKSERIDADKAVKVLANTPFPDQYLQGLAPSHPAYAALKAELAKLSKEKVAPPEFEQGKRIKIGQKDPRIVALRARLIRDGFMDAAESAAAEKQDVLDKKLAKALKAFQVAKAVPQTSALDAITIKALNGPDLAGAREKLVTNLERFRWLPHNLGKRYVFVNQAAFNVTVIDGQQPVWTSRVIVGKPNTQTAVFSDEMETVVFNPTWGVPASIILKEYLPKLRSNPGYLDKIGFKVTNAKGKVVSSRSINWNSVGSKNLSIGIQQPSGDDNALGEIKFLFPNSHSIYMHDTPNRNLFNESQRAFSHGCVRVQNPREFAQVVLGWDAAKVDSSVDGKKSWSVSLSQKLPVHLTYFTAWPDKDGKVSYYQDFYGRDQTMENARKIIAKMYSTSASQQLVETRKPSLATITD